VDRPTGAPAKREAILGKGQRAEAEHRALLALEDELEAAARKALPATAATTA
jgi:hypothetical protein